MTNVSMPASFTVNGLLAPDLVDRTSVTVRLVEAALKRVMVAVASPVELKVTSLWPVAQPPTPG